MLGAELSHTLLALGNIIIIIILCHVLFYLYLYRKILDVDRNLISAFVFSKLLKFSLFIFFPRLEDLLQRVKFLLLELEMSRNVIFRSIKLETL